MGEITEEKLKIENDTFALKREYKYALQNLSSIKQETAETIAIKEKVTNEVAAAKTELNTVLNQIAEEKNEWAQHRNSELVELESKQSEANNVLKRKAELNIQEETIRQITTKDLQAVADLRTLEFKLSQDKTAIEVEKNGIKIREEELSNREGELKKEHENFKQKVVAILNEVEKI